MDCCDFDDVCHVLVPWVVVAQWDVRGDWFRLQISIWHDRKDMVLSCACIAVHACRSGCESCLSIKHRANTEAKPGFSAGLGLPVVSYGDYNPP